LGLRLGREEQALRDVAESRLAPRIRQDVFLADERDDGARDHVPVIADRHRHDGLHIQEEASALTRSEAVVVVELQGHADQACDRIGELLG
jgi:hypothetical protein